MQRRSLEDIASRVCTEVVCEIPQGLLPSLLHPDNKLWCWCYLPISAESDKVPAAIKGLSD